MFVGVLGPGGLGSWFRGPWGPGWGQFPGNRYGLEVWIRCKIWFSDAAGHLQSYRDANPRCSFSVPVCKPLAWKILLHLIPLVMQVDVVGHAVDDDGLHHFSVLSLSGEFYFH